MMINENDLEKLLLGLFEGIDYEVLHGSNLSENSNDSIRSTYQDNILHAKLRSALELINPTIPDEKFEEVVDYVNKKIDLKELEKENKSFHEIIINGYYAEYLSEKNKKINGIINLIDFKNPLRNNFCLVNQFLIFKNGKKYILDAVVFVNGIPLVAIEIKNGLSAADTKQETYEQLQNYKNNVPSLFRSNLFIAIINGLEALITPFSAPIERLMNWRTPDIYNKQGYDNSKKISHLVNGLFTKENFIDFIENFVIFDNNNRKIIKKIATYYQYYCTNKLYQKTLTALKENKSTIGTVFHTPGSGKTLSMLFYSKKLICKIEKNRPTIILLSDRNDIDIQSFNIFGSYADFFKEKPVQASSRSDLKKQLSSHKVGGIISSTVQKFSNKSTKISIDILSKRENIIVIVDEAHRSHYNFIDGFAKDLRQSLPNAKFVAFTGTPIFTSTKNTALVFGKIIDTYNMQQAFIDNVTVPVYYESRLSKLHLNQEEKTQLDTFFTKTTDGEDDATKQRLKTENTKVTAILNSKAYISSITQDILEHFSKRSEVIKGKGLIVCSDREKCVRIYQEIIECHPKWHSDSETKGKIKVVMTGSAKDPADFQPHIWRKRQLKFIAQRFKDPEDSLTLVIVCDMWLTGFDIPCLHTLYISKKIKDHTLIQAISRVNRTYAGKPNGLIVDYAAILSSLKKAFAQYAYEIDSQIFDEEGISSAIEEMQKRYHAIKMLLKGVDLSEEKINSTEKILETIFLAMDTILKEKNGRENFLRNFSDLSNAFSLCATTEEAQSISNEVAFFNSLRIAFSNKNESKKNYKNLNKKISKVVSDSITSEGVVNLFSSAGMKNKQISIFSDEFLEEIKKIDLKNLAVETLKKLLEDEVNERLKRNIVRRKKLSEMLQATINRYHNQAISNVQVIEELIKIAKTIRKEKEKGKELKLNEDESAFYDALADNQSARDVFDESKLALIAQEVAEAIKNSTTIDWTIKESLKAKIRVKVKRILRKHGYPPDLQEKATMTVLKQAEILSETES